MSENEFHALIGMTAQEEVRLQAELIELDKHIEQVADGLIHLGSTARKRTGLGARCTQLLSAPAELVQYGELADVINLVNSRIGIEKRLDEINSFLIRMKARSDAPIVAMMREGL